MTIHFHVGHNMPGYMPMDDEPPYSFLTFEDAKRSMIDDLDRAGDHLASSDDEETRALADHYSAEMEELNLLTEGPRWDAYLPTSTSEHDLGEHYWISECAEDECEVEDA